MGHGDLDGGGLLAGAWLEGGGWMKRGGRKGAVNGGGLGGADWMRGGLSDRAVGWREVTGWREGWNGSEMRGDLTWTNASITFSFASGGVGEPEKYVVITGMDRMYRILPDAVVMTKELKTMAVVGISGWQAFKGKWGSSHYGKDDLLWIRTEINPIIGVTTSSMIPPRNAGYPVYRKGSEKPYYLHKGVQSTISIDEVKMASEQTPSEVHVEVRGHSTKPLNAPDRQIVALLDAMLQLRRRQVWASGILHESYER
ncbi:unnamed protein product [Symbiodinium sp. CCMP2592]|nr:unnamed protein product [Symbiodinium sp. CCMP2592]